MTPEERTPAAVPVALSDYDEALVFYVGKFGFELSNDTIAG